MKILINDYESEKENYVSLFLNNDYEANELIFCHSFEESKNFINDSLANKKLHIDAIITNESTRDTDNVLKASELNKLKDRSLQSFSYGNCRISSIPIILYSDNENSTISSLFGYNAVVKKGANYISSLIWDLEYSIREWRQNLLIDLEILGLQNMDLNSFIFSPHYKKYQRKISQLSGEHYFLKTKILSEEYIKLPRSLHYDWLQIIPRDIEKAIGQFNSTYTRHSRYNKKNNERTVLHDFFNKNKLILLRGAYVDLEYERNLRYLGERTSEECDFILKTEYPDFLRTTFFEVKKEDVTFYVKKNTRRPQISSNFLSHLEQVWRYKEYSEDDRNAEELESKLGYGTNLFNHVLLAGRLDEKLEMQEKFESDLNRMYKGIDVITYEDLEELNMGYYNKFKRLSL